MGPRGYSTAQLSELSDMRFIEQCFTEFCCICLNLKHCKYRKASKNNALPSDLASHFNLFGFDSFFIFCIMRSQQEHELQYRRSPVSSTKYLKLSFLVCKRQFLECLFQNYKRFFHFMISIKI